jgi:hypothetical protein
MAGECMTEAWLQPNNISYPLVNLYAAKNVHGYVAYSKTKRGTNYVSNPWAKKGVRLAKRAWEMIGFTPVGPECNRCGANPDSEDHQFQFIRLTDEDGRLLNEDGTLLTITHNRPNLQAWLTGINEVKDDV